MNLAISNIAWSNEEEAGVAGAIVDMGVSYVEIAPTKLWADPTAVNEDSALGYVQWWAERDVTIAAFQSMLFARPDLKIFDSEENREELFEYMERFFKLAKVMGAKSLVFGSPKNRQRGQMSEKEAFDIARDFFSRLGAVASREGVVLCLEPNAKQYSCDFITSAQEGAELVRAVDSSGFKLHLDTACMALAGDDIYESVVQNADILQHFHISAPMLDDVRDRGDVDYASAARALHDINYQNILSIEMRPQPGQSNVERVRHAVGFVRETFH